MSIAAADHVVRSYHKTVFRTVSGVVQRPVGVPPPAPVRRPNKSPATIRPGFAHVMMHRVTVITVGAIFSMQMFQAVLWLSVEPLRAGRRRGGECRTDG